MSKSKDKSVPALVNTRTGAIVLLNAKNGVLKKRRDMKETRVVREEDTGKYVEVDNSDMVVAIAASRDIARIGTALLNLQEQRQLLLTSALKLPGAAEYLVSLGVYKAEEDDQYIDPDSLAQNNAGLPRNAFTEAEVGQVRDVTEELQAEADAKAAEKSEEKKPTRRSSKRTTPDKDSTDI